MKAYAKSLAQEVGVNLFLLLVIGNWKSFYFDKINQF